MTAVFLVIHVLIAITLVLTILLQRSDGGALGGLGGGAFGGVMSGRQSANLLTRTTAILAASFMGTSMILGILASGASEPRSILDTPAAAAAAEVESSAPAPAAPDTGPSAPIAE